MYQLVFEIVRRTIELSRFRYSYAFLTHFSRWGPVLNDCSFSRSSLKYDSQPVACPGLQELENGSGEGWIALSHSTRKVRPVLRVFHQITWWNLLRLQAMTIHGLRSQGSQNLPQGFSGPTFHLLQHLHATANNCPVFKWTDTTLQGRQPIFHPGKTFLRRFFQQNGFFLFLLKTFPVGSW